MFTKLFTTIFGKKESIQRRIIKTAILYILIVIAIAAFLFLCICTKIYQYKTY